MNVLPFLLLPALSMGSALGVGIWHVLHGGSLLPGLAAVVRTLGGSWLTFFLLGAYTTLTEWKLIRTTPLRKLGYLFTFPLFIITYLPVGIASLFYDPGWKPIYHGACRTREEPEGRRRSRVISAGQ